MVKFKTIKELNETVIKEKSSLFIARAYPIEDENEAIKILDKIKRKYFDSSHNCYAYRLHGKKVKYSDSGEPSGTAGIRILNAINHFNLNNVLVVIFRYFGGTKLGVGLLGRTYYNSALKVLENSIIIEKIGYNKISIEANLNQLKNIYSIIDQFKGKAVKPDYTNNFKIECLISYSEVEKFNFFLNEISKGKVKVKVDGNILFL